MCSSNVVSSPRCYAIYNFLHKFIPMAIGSWVPRVSPSGSRLWVYLNVCGKSNQSPPESMVVTQKNDRNIKHDREKKNYRAALPIGHQLLTQLLSKQ